MNFVNNNFNFCLNEHFLKFMINFYQTRHLKTLLAEFLLKFSDPKLFKDKHALTVISNGLNYYGLFKENLTILNYILDNIDSRCKDTMINLMLALSTIDPKKSNEIRLRLENIKVDLSHENISSLLSEVVLKFKRNVIKSTKKKKKKKIRFPKNFDPKKPGPMPDSERWVPRLQRKRNRGLANFKKAYHGGETTEGAAVTTGSTNTGATFSHFK